MTVVFNSDRPHSVFTERTVEAPRLCDFRDAYRGTSNGKRDSNLDILDSHTFESLSRLASTQRGGIFQCDIPDSDGTGSVGSISVFIQGRDRIGVVYNRKIIPSDKASACHADVGLFRCHLDFNHAGTLLAGLVTTYYPGREPESGPINRASLCLTFFPSDIHRVERKAHLNGAP